MLDDLGIFIQFDALIQVVSVIPLGHFFKREILEYFKKHWSKLVPFLQAIKRILLKQSPHQFCVFEVMVLVIVYFKQKHNKMSGIEALIIEIWPEAI